VAIPLVNRALEVLGEHCPDPGQKAELRFTLARALHPLHKDPAQVKELLVQARDELESFPWKKPVLDELTTWVQAQHLVLPPSGPPSEKR
jgi:hypothetical protein